MARRKQRERRRIRHTQALDPNDSGVSIDHRSRIVDPAHGTCRSRMPDGVEVLADVILNLLVRDHFFAGVVLVADDEALHGSGGVELANALEARDHDVDVGSFGQVVGVDERWNADIGGGDGDVPSRSRCDQCGSDRRVVEAIERTGGSEILHVAQVCRRGNIFHLGPVGGIGSQSGSGLVAPLLAEIGGNLFPGKHIRTGTRVQASGFVIVQLGLLRSESRVVGKLREGNSVDPVCDVVPHMVLHTLSDSRPVRHYWNIEALQGSRGANTGDHQEMRRTEGSSGHDHFLAGG